MIKKKVLVFYLIKMVINMLENLKMIKKMVIAIVANDIQDLKETILKYHPVNQKKS